MLSLGSGNDCTFGEVEMSLYGEYVLSNILRVVWEKTKGDFQQSGISCTTNTTFHCLYILSILA